MGNADGPVNGEEFVEPVHDALTMGWQRLRQWHQADQERVTLAQSLDPAVQAWVQRRRSPEFLWHQNPRLPLLVQVLKSQDCWLNRRESRFVRFSQMRSRGRNLFVAALCFVMALMMLGSVAIAMAEISDTNCVFDFGEFE